MRARSRPLQTSGSRPRTAPSCPLRQTWGTHMGSFGNLHKKSSHFFIRFIASRKSLMLIFLRFTGSKDFTSSIFSSLKERQISRSKEKDSPPYWAIGGISGQSSQV